MTPEIAILLLLIAIMIFLFLTEKLPIDVTAVLALSALILLGYLTPKEAFTGFSSPAVIILICMSFIGAALSSSGVTDSLARYLGKFVGKSEIKAVLVLSFVSAFLSAFMNNVAAVSVMLPAAASLAFQAEVSPSRLMIPVSFAAILGGMTTLIGTTPNIIAADLISQSSSSEIGFVDFAWVGIPIALAGIFFIVFIARLFLPKKDFIGNVKKKASKLASVYKLFERLFILEIPEKSSLSGMSLGEVKLGSVLGLNVIAVRRKEKKILNPNSEFVLASKDELIVQGRLNKFKSLLSFSKLKIENEKKWKQEDKVLLTAEIQVLNENFIGKNITELNFSNTFGLVVVGIKRAEEFIVKEIARTSLSLDDRLLVIGKSEAFQEIKRDGKFKILTEIKNFSELEDDHLFWLSPENDSELIATPLKESRLSEYLGARVIGVLRNHRFVFDLKGETEVMQNDALLVCCQKELASSLSKLKDLILKSDSAESKFKEEDLKIEEAVIAPRSSFIGKTLIEANFREKFDLQVLAIWREGKPLRSELATRELKLGDALLLHGASSSYSILNEEEGVLLLTDNWKEDLKGANVQPRYKRWVAIFSLILMVLLSVFEVAPVHIAAFFGAVFAVSFGALRMDDAYKKISWRIIVLIACLMPLGIAVTNSGTASFISDFLLYELGNYGPKVVLIALCLVSSLISQSLDASIAIVLLAPVAIETSNKLGLSPVNFMLAMSIASSIAFLTPFSHKASLLVMGPGGYRGRDYFRSGVGLSVMCFILLYFLIIYFYPL